MEALERCSISAVDTPSLHLEKCPFRGKINLYTARIPPEQEPL